MRLVGEQLAVLSSEGRYEFREQILLGDDAVRRDPDRRVDAARARRDPQGATASAYTALIALAHLDDGRDAAGAVDAAADSRHPERADAPRAAASSVSGSICQGDEFGELGSSFNAVSAQLSAVRTKALPAVGSTTDFESVMENLEDAVAIVSPEGELMFANSGDARAAAGARPSARRGSGQSTLSLPGRQHPVRQLVEQALAGRKSAGPLSIAVRHATEADRSRPSACCCATRSTMRRAGSSGPCSWPATSVYLSQVHSTVSYSRKLAALGRLMAGVAHEVKNPLNAMTIHLELLKQKLGGDARADRRCPPGRRAARRRSISTKHVNVIGDEIRGSIKWWSGS